MLEPLLVFHFLSLAQSHSHPAGCPALVLSLAGQKSPGNWDVGGTSAFPSPKAGWDPSVVSGSSVFQLLCDDK